MDDHDTRSNPRTWSQKKKRSKKRWRLLLLVGVVVGCLLLIETAVRVRLYWQTGSFSLVHRLELDPASGLEVPIPGRHTKSIHIDSRGFRNSEVFVPKPKGRVRIAFLGASTTFCAEATSNESTWPHLVWEKLSAQYPDLKIDYVNAAVAGYPVERSVKNLEYRVKSLAPDVIVICHAINDIAKDTRAEAIKQGVYTDHADRDSWLSRYSLAWYLVEKNLLIFQRQRISTSESNRLEVDADALAEGFRERLNHLVRDAKKITPKVVLVTFAHQVRREQDPKTRLAACNTALYYMPYMTPSTILDCLDSYNRAIRRVGEEEGVLVIDDEKEIPGNRVHFADSVHLNDAGCRAMAHRVSSQLIEADFIRR